MANSLFAVGNLVCSVDKAKGGTIDAVIIKNVILACSRKTHARSVFLYEDTSNRLWNEDELCSQADAVAIASSACAKKIAEIQTAIAACED